MSGRVVANVSSEIPSPTNIGEISKIAPDALASSTRPSGSNKTKFKLNELCSSHGSRNPAVVETGDAFPRDTQDDYSPLASKRLVETPGPQLVERGETFE
ncbi:hypothetical protein K0M31_015846 [Melipona bicolor]|uniref:Uncharacterized protein n=1 Tax=Melipona bicolor TaxID=60889 RepID=A0AA40FF35_9HYME|nr:hypothetical protein K0M31_015846 [Melipona bicolor]